MIGIHDNTSCQPNQSRSVDVGRFFGERIVYDMQVVDGGLLWTTPNFRKAQVADRKAEN